MADGITIVKAPEEKLSNFNTRLQNSCGEVSITSAQLAVVDGQPVVTLFSEIVDADDDDVAAAAEEGETIKVGDPIPSEEPVCVQICPIRAGSLTEATKTQERMETLYKRAQGAVVAVLHANGKGIDRVVDPVSKKETFVEKDMHYAMVVYNPTDADEQTDANG